MNYRMFWNPFLRISLLVLLVPLMLCEKASPKPGLKGFREDYKSITETCRDIGFIKKCECIAGKSMVVFDVRLKNHKRNLGKGSKVVFETVDLNEGLGYDASSGVFTAPHSGIYVFDWTIVTLREKGALTSVVVNGPYKSWNYCNDRTKNLWLSCSKTTVIKLKQGDKVWIGVYSGPADIHKQYTSFSGYKL
ncbi:complement C1q tumor necrosis factor-related protein 2-like [Ostrea edulis]|uniref:complement C1q tumor necrosis factor-related protein 2-like n=1 Tax=Ostrea edulis TaxID=37623 RepID=UPI0024AF6E04|nr:complement C1q tumor necrosis factor-related protein 2-like [Ostrea edulis]